MKEKLIGKKYLPHRTVIGFVLGIIAGLLFRVHPRICVNLHDGVE